MSLYRIFDVGDGLRQAEHRCGFGDCDIRSASRIVRDVANKHTRRQLAEESAKRSQDSCTPRVMGQILGGLLVFSLEPGQHRFLFADFRGKAAHQVASDKAAENDDQRHRRQRDPQRADELMPRV